MKTLAQSFTRFCGAAALLAAAQGAWAADYLLDASTMAVGASAGTNLVAKEGCLDPTQTTCAEKLKWLRAPLGKVGSLEITGTLQGSFEVTVIGDFDSGAKSIAITNSENKGVQYRQSGMDTCCPGASFDPIGIGTNQGDNRYSSWNGGTRFNTITVTVQNGVARASVNGGQWGTEIIFDPSTTFNRVVIQGITTDDRLTEVRTTGILSACTSGTTGGTTGSTSTTAVTLDANLGMRIPNLIYKPILGNAMNLWADLQFAPAADGSLAWKLKNYGVNP